MKEGSDKVEGRRGGGEEGRGRGGRRVEHEGRRTKQR